MDPYQYLCMAFAQLTFCAPAFARACGTWKRDWRIYAEFAQRLIGIARKRYVNEPLGVDLANTAYALDSTTIDLSLLLVPWAPCRTTKAATSCIRRKCAQRNQCLARKSLAACDTVAFYGVVVGKRFNACQQETPT